MSVFRETRRDVMPGLVVHQTLSRPESAEDDTDELGRLIQQHARDEQRLNNLLQSERAAFRKGRHLPNSMSHTPDTSRTHGAPTYHRAPSSVSSTNSEPAPKVASEWGSRSKYSRDWLQRGLDAEHSMRSRRAADSVALQPQAFTGATSASLATTYAALVDQSPSPSRRSANSLGRDTASDQELTASSVLASTPAVSVRPNGTYRTRSERVADVAKFSRRLGAPRELDGSASPDRHLRDTKPSRVKFADVLPNKHGSPVRHPDNKENQPFMDNRPIDARSPDLGHLPQSMHTTADKFVLPEDERETFSRRRLRQSSAAAPELWLEPDQQETKRMRQSSANAPELHPDDRYGLDAKRVRQSSSLAPELRTKEFDAGRLRQRSANAPELQLPETDDFETRRIRQRSVNAPELDVNHPRDFNSIRRRQQSANAPELFVDDLDENDSRRIRQSSANAPELVVSSPESHLTPAPQRVTGYEAKTPVVTGAWVDTPQPARITTQLARTNTHDGDAWAPASAGTDDEPKSSARSPRSQSKSGNSALGDLVQSIRQKGKDIFPAELGDDTIASLENLVDLPTQIEAVQKQNDEASLSQTLDLQTIKTELEKLHAAGRPISEADKKRESELNTLMGMNTLVRQMHNDIKGANSDLARIENVIADTTCRSCNRPRSLFKALGQEVLTLFITTHASSESQVTTAISIFSILTSKPHFRRHKLTWLSMILLLFCFWYLLENTLCKFHCHPTYATRMRSYGVDPLAPRYPYVLPTLIFRPLRWAWQPLMSFGVWAGSALLNPDGIESAPVGARSSHDSAFEYLFGGRRDLGRRAGRDLGSGSGSGQLFAGVATSAASVSGASSAAAAASKDWISSLEDDEPVFEDEGSSFFQNRGKWSVLPLKRSGHLDEGREGAGRIDARKGRMRNEYQDRGHDTRIHTRRAWESGHLGNRETDEFDDVAIGDDIFV